MRLRLGPQYSWQYTWQYLKAIREIFVTTVIAQIVGSVIFLFIRLTELITLTEDCFLDLWLGCALFTFPGYLAGVQIQVRIRPNSIEENKTLVRKTGLMALTLTVAAVFTGLMHVRYRIPNNNPLNAEHSFTRQLNSKSSVRARLWQAFCRKHGVLLPNSTG